MNIQKDIIEAEKRIRPYIDETPLKNSEFLSKLSNNNVYLKLENFQKTGSFKIRGAFNALLSLYDKMDKARFITASSGNHGIAFAHAINELGLQGTIYLPKNTPPVKIESLRGYDVEIKLYGTDCVQTEMYAREIAEKKKLTFISPYNDTRIIAGQGTIGVELERQLSNIDAVFVPIGGGGLISGISAYLKNINSKVNIVGCQPENSPVMYESIKAGKIIDMVSKPTLSDGTAGGIEAESITFEMCKRYVDDYVLVSEDEIKKAIRVIVEEHGIKVEGAAVLSIGALSKYETKSENKNIVLLISGSRIDEKKLKEILDD